MTRPFLSLTTDFGVQSQGIGILHSVALEIAPDANVVDLMHGLPSFGVTAAARTLEAIQYLQVGHHVCVCDPGVGTKRAALVIKVGRGDHLIGPDNGVLIPASRVLGGIVEARVLENQKYMRHPVSALFHGRDVFVPAGAHLAAGVPMSAFGPAIDAATLVKPPYEEAVINGASIACRVIQINKFGSIHLNILHASWDNLDLELGTQVRMSLPSGTKVSLPYARTFGDVEEGKPVLLKDDYGRIEGACNLGSFVERYPVRVGDSVLIEVDPV